MSKSGTVFNLVDGLLAPAACVNVRQPGGLQLLYAGIGMPSLRIEELASEGHRSYCQIRAANPLHQLAETPLIRERYAVLREQAVTGDADALNDLGWLWLNGSRLAPDPALASHLFRIAALQGSAEALFNLAEQHAYGKGGEVDACQARDYYEQAYEQGIRCAAQALGSLYENGADGLAADHAQAIAWYRRGAEEQDRMACYQLGRLALDETSPACDPPLGLYWLQWAAMQGEVLASERLVLLYATAFVSPPDPDARLYQFWRDTAIRQGADAATLA